MSDLAKPAVALFANAHFIVGACGTCYIPGYLILKPRDAVRSLSQMRIGQGEVFTPLISGRDRDETLESIQGWLTPSATEEWRATQNQPSSVTIEYLASQHITQLQRSALHG